MDQVMRDYVLDVAGSAAVKAASMPVPCAVLDQQAGELAERAVTAYVRTVRKRLAGAELLASLAPDMRVAVQRDVRRNVRRSSQEARALFERVYLVELARLRPCCHGAHN